MKYFTLKKAQNEARIIPTHLTDEQLQKHIVKLRDYKRYIDTPDRKRLTQGGYYGLVVSSSASGVVPVDIWLQTNLSYALDEATKEKQNRAIQHSH